MSQLYNSGLDMLVGKVDLVLTVADGELTEVKELRVRGVVFEVSRTILPTRWHVRRVMRWDGAEPVYADVTPPEGVRTRREAKAAAEAEVAADPTRTPRRPKP